MHQAEKVGHGAPSSSEQILEKMFSLFIEQGNLWPEICGLSEIKGRETSESSLYGYVIRQSAFVSEKCCSVELFFIFDFLLFSKFKIPK